MLSSDFVSRFCGQILFTKTFKYFYRAVSKNNTFTRVADYASADMYVENMQIGRLTNVHLCAHI